MADHEERTIRQLWSEEAVQDVPRHVADEEIYAWQLHGFVLRYLPAQRLSPAFIRSLDIRFEEQTLALMQSKEEVGIHDPFALSSGWHLIEASPQTVWERDEVEEIDVDTAQWLEPQARLYQLLYRSHQVPQISWRLTSSPQLLKAVNLLYLLNVSEEEEITEELCRDFAPGTICRSVDGRDGEVWVNSLDTKDQFAGGLRRSWKVPHVLRSV